MIFMTIVYALNGKIDGRNIIEVLYNTCLYNTYDSFVSYNTKKNPHMLNAVPISL